MGKIGRIGELIRFYNKNRIIFIIMLIMPIMLN